MDPRTCHVQQLRPHPQLVLTTSTPASREFAVSLQGSLRAGQAGEGPGQGWGRALPWCGRGQSGRSQCALLALPSPEAGGGLAGLRPGERAGHLSVGALGGWPRPSGRQRRCQILGRAQPWGEIEAHEAEACHVAFKH